MKFQLSPPQVTEAIAQWVVNKYLPNDGKFDCHVEMQVVGIGHHPTISATVEATPLSAHPTEVAHDDHGGSGEHAEEEATPEKLPPTQDG